MNKEQQSAYLAAINRGESTRAARAAADVRLLDVILKRKHSVRFDVLELTAAYQAFKRGEQFDFVGGIDPAAGRDYSVRYTTRNCGRTWARDEAVRRHMAKGGTVWMSAEDVAAAEATQDAYDAAEYRRALFGF